MADNSCMVILVGASASGKTEVARYLQAVYGMRKATTTTSRPPRKGERDGIDYFFVSKEDFERLFEAGQLVERAVYSGNFYGCGVDQVAHDRTIVLDPNGLHHFQALNDPGIVTFFLKASEETRRKRMVARGDKKEDIEKRLSNDRDEFSDAKMPTTDFTIQTDSKSISEIAAEVVCDYRSALESRGILVD